MRERIIAVLFVFCLIFNYGCTGGGSVDAGPSLFTENTQQGHPTPSSALGYVRYRFVDVADNYLVDARVTRLTLNLFSDLSYSAVRDSFEQLEDGSYVWTGHIVGVQNSEVEFVNDGGSVVGIVRVGSRSYEVGYDDGWQIAAELDPNLPEPTTDAIEIDPTKEAAQSTKGSAAAVPPTKASADDGSVIDVMVVYTAAARKAAAGIGDLPDKGIRAKIDLAVKETNQGFVNSGVNTKVRLVHAAEVSFDESEMTPSEALSEMKDGKIGSVHAWRDTYKADLVVMLALYPREDVSGESLGVGYVMSGRYLDKQTLVYPFEHLGYSIVGVNYATGYYTFAHEMGHNMGLCHYYDVSTITAAESGGYAWKTTLFRSIMGPPAGVPRINYWSNPSVKYSGLATGGTGLDGSFVYGGNEATVLNWTRAIVAKFR